MSNSIWMYIYWKRGGGFVDKDVLDITDIVALAVLEHLYKEEKITKEIFEKAKVMLSQV